MASSGKKKTTMAKLTRESKLRERRLDKQARKDARKREAANTADGADETLDPTGPGAAQLDAGEPAQELVAEAHADA
jgi:hypothetical protein